MAARTYLTQKDFRVWTETIEKARINIGVQGMSVAVVYKGETIYTQGFGKRNEKDPFTVETLSCIASMTKAFTAAAVGELVAEGKASWLTPINEYIPEFKSKNPYLTAEINLVDILTHRTGYPSLDLHWFHRRESRSELIKQLRYVEPAAPLRTRWHYNNAMFSLAGEVSARIEGKSWEDIVRDRIFIPAGMNSSGFSVKKLVEQPNHAVPFRSKSFEAAQRGENHPIPPDMGRMPDAPSGDIFSNVIDIAKWAKVMLQQGKLDNKQVLGTETVQAVTTAWMVVNDWAAGLGWIVDHFKGHRMIHHSGGYSGYASYISLFPDDDLAVIVLSNKDNTNIGDQVPLYMADYILDLPKTDDWLFDKLVEAEKNHYESQTPKALEQFFPPQIKNKPPTRKLQDFTGEWTHPYGTPLSVVLNGKGQLVLKIADYEGVLGHYHYDSFRLR
ncbi:hypothetical protein BGZ73_009116, partial [Actinomortierella ambigua]